MLVVDFMHEFELGVWKSTFTHIIRILVAHGGNSIQHLNQRFRAVPTFGRDTIRRFSNDVSAMKKLAARDYEDLLQQCSMPVFEGLLPSPFNEILMDLLYELAEWHAFAKQRMHTETSLSLFENATARLGIMLRKFKSDLCSRYDTYELEKEVAARGRRNAALSARSQHRGDPPGSHAQPTSGKGKEKSPRTRRKKKEFNISTYKLHALGHYPHTIRLYGTTDSYTTQPVSAVYTLTIT
ncbi:hypothetical protein BV22DRAFT_1027248 [Leucogyrophana mollusca]|uniref:Uncharacterized protein n=1 Tax=Leucogyrophana mollusca TaxID=85980 RepID=A0ACB8AWV7_9AGAM|nr:hypothetical protein BV22DRAFT_1027248 [Leucogyrophana mollusca]